MFGFVGIQGYVSNELSSPMRNATVKVFGADKTYKVTPNMAFYKIMLPPGTYSVRVECHGYSSQTLELIVVQNEITNKNVKLIKETIIAEASTNNERGPVSGNAHSSYRKISGM